MGGEGFCLVIKQLMIDFVCLMKCGEIGGMIGMNSCEWGVDRVLDGE